MRRSEGIDPSTPDYSVAYNHLDLMLECLGVNTQEDIYDLKKAMKTLDANHYGMHKMKRKDLEYIAVLKLKGDMKARCYIL